MYRNDHLTKAVMGHVRNAELMALEDYQSTAVEHEPQITDRLLAYLQSEFHGQTIGGVAWRAKTLTSQAGTASQETRFGADFMGVINLNLPGYTVKKGFLAQAKRIEPGQKLSKNNYLDLVDQCDLMLSATPVSYVFIYSAQSGVRIASALDVASAAHCNPLDLTTISLPEFFKRHVECHIGDRRISNANVASLQGLAQEYGVRTISAIYGNSLDRKIYA